MFKQIFSFKSKESAASPAAVSDPAPVPAPAPAGIAPAAAVFVATPPAAPSAPSPVPVQVSAPSTAAANAKKGRDISLYRNLLAGLYDGLLIMDSKGNITGSNQRAEFFLGYSEQELWGMQSEELIIGINAKVLYKLQANAESGRFTMVNGTCKRKDGTTFPAEIAISRVRMFNEGDLIFSIRNIERKEKSREHREMSVEAIRYAGAGILVCSTEGIIEFVNPAFLKLMNVDDEHEVLKHTIGDFCPSYEGINAMIHAPSTHGIWVGNLELVTPKGTKREVSVTAALSQIRRGGIQRLILTMTPVPKSIA